MYVCLSVNINRCLQSLVRIMVYFFMENCALWSEQQGALKANLLEPFTCSRDNCRVLMTIAPLRKTWAECVEIPFAVRWSLVLAWKSFPWFMVTNPPKCACKTCTGGSLALQMLVAEQPNAAQNVFVFFCSILDQRCSATSSACLAISYWNCLYILELRR